MNPSQPGSLTTNDTTPPAAVDDLLVNPTGTLLIGTGEPGAQVSVSAGAVSLGTARVAADGSFSINLAAPQLDGQTLTVIQRDISGNSSAPVSVIAPDTTAPVPPADFALIDAGLTLTGTGEAGATVQVRNAIGTILGTDIVAQDGTFSIGLSSAQRNGETLSIRQLDLAGNTSGDASYQVPDVTPAAPVTGLALSASGLILSGAGQAGATVVVTDGTGELGTAVVGADGRFTVNLSAAQLNGQQLSVVQTDVSNLPSTPVPYTAADSTAPSTPTLLTLAESLVTGTAEAGSTVTIRTADGTFLGSAVTNAQGVYSVALNTPQSTGAPLNAVASDAASNASSALIFDSLDTVPPEPVTGLSVSADYLYLTGLGEPGADVIVTSGGVEIGTTVVDPDGTFNVTFATPLSVDQVLSVVQSDQSANASDPTTFDVPQTPPPAAPAGLALSADGVTLAGQAGVGDVIEVRGENGALLGSTTVPAGDGSFSLTLSPPQTNGEVLSVTAASALGGASTPAIVTADDSTDPAGLENLAISSGGTLVTGTGEPDATVVIRNAAGALLGTSIVAPDGSFSVTLSVAQTNGQVLNAIQTDLAGNVSPVSQATAADTTAPLLADNLLLDPAGTNLSGTGEANATVRVTNASGVLLGEGRVTADGGFSLVLTQAQTNGQVLNVTLTDAANNTSVAATVTAADSTPPAAPAILTVVGSGLQVTGTGEPGATIRITNAAGTELGNGPVGADGNFRVLLSSAQLNGQVLSVTQTDAAGNQSAALATTAPDTTAPTLASDLAVAADGSSLSGTGEAGATANVYNASGQLLGTATVGSNGQFSVTLTPAQNDGQVLNVRLADTGNNVSLPAEVTAPDTTPPAEPVSAVISPNGSLMTGTGFAGFRILVRNLSGGRLGSAVVAADGTWQAIISPPQTNNEPLSVVQVDAAGNESPALPVTAPDLTAPVPAGALLLSADGTTLSGTAEAGSTVTVKNAAGMTLSTATALANGTFSLTLASPQINGEALSVQVTDPRGNASLTSTLVAPDVDVDRPVVASDNLATATVTLAPVSTTRNILDSFPTVLGLGFTHTFNFTVDAETVANSTLTLTTGGLLDLAGQATYTLQVRDAGGNWVTLGTAVNGSLLNLSLLSNGGVFINMGTLRAGDYQLVFASNSVSLLTTINSNLQLDITSLTQFNGAAGAAVTGNVITDIGTDGTADVTGPDNGAQLRVQNGGSGYVNAGSGTTVQGLYGTLTIDAQGNYTYRANGSANSVGKVDVFNYQLVHPNGKSDSATLYVRIDSPQAMEVWNESNLAAPALVVDASNDVANTDITLGNRVATSTSTIGALTTLIGIGLGASANSGAYLFNVEQNTVSDLTLTLSSGSLLSLLGATTLSLSKLNTTTGQYQVVKSWAGASLVNLGGGVYGVNVEDQTPGAYRVNLSISGIVLATTITVGLINTATYNNQFVVNSYTPVTGNLLTDTAGGSADVLGSALTVLSVMAAANTYVQPGYNGTSVTGNYGTLLVRADGSYSYTLKAGLTAAVIGQEDVFTYQLTHPNGTTDTATLTIDLNQAGVAARTALTSVDDDATFSALSASTGDEALSGTDGNDTLDGSKGGGITLDGGAGNDTLIISDQDFVAVHGGTGMDTLLWNGGDAAIDLGNLQGRVDSIEVIDLNATSSVELTLSLADLVAVIDPEQSVLLIKGTEQDSVHMTGEWFSGGTQLADGLEYTQYTPQEDSTHQLWVQNGVQVV